MVKVTETVEVEVDISTTTLADMFANMVSDEQAEFLARAFKTMSRYKGAPGSFGRQTQMLGIKEHFDEYPDAKDFIEDLYNMTHDE